MPVNSMDPVASVDAAAVGVTLNCDSYYNIVKNVNIYNGLQY